MRRALVAAIAGGALLALTACGSDANNGSAPADQATPPPSPTAESTFQAPDYTANTKQVCGKVAAIYSGTGGYLDRIKVERIADFHEQMIQRLHSENEDLLKKIAGGEWDDSTEDALGKARGGADA